MKQAEFIDVLRKAYDFPSYSADNVDSADEILEDMREEQNLYRIDIEPFFTALFAEAGEVEAEAMLKLMRRHFLQ